MGSVRGLAWLARVGPAPLEAWGCAMGWRRRSVFSHADRLVRAGWAVRYPMVRGQGSLLVASRSGVRIAGVAVTPSPRPAPTWWAHLQACAWMAAWLTVREREMQGPREVVADASWSGELRWSDRSGSHKAGHRPDLAWLADGVRVAVEVELARKSTPRLEAIVALHARWRAAGRTGGVIYVCGDKQGCDRVRDIAATRGLGTGRGEGLRVEALAVIREQAMEASAAG